MAGKHTCPSCNTGDAKRIGDIVKQEAAGGVKSGLAEQYNPPKQPWGYVEGFVLAIPVNAGLIMALGTQGESEGGKALIDILTSVVFLGVWVGYGAWRNKSYTKELEEWKSVIAAKLHCLKCGHVFST